MNPIAWAVIIPVTALWVWMLIAVIRHEKRQSAKRWAEFNAVRAAFEALPKPKNEIPSTLRKVRKW